LKFLRNKRLYNENIKPVLYFFNTFTYKFAYVQLQKCKDNVPVYATKTHRVSRGIVPFSINHGTRWRWI